LGDHTTQDEYGTAAYKTVELDDYLGGLPVQHRETQGNESKTFISYFPKGIRILEGGVESGFRHVKPEEYKPRLLHVKGSGQNIKVQQTHLSRDALNSGDVFILDKGLRVFQFNGAKSAGAERMKAAQVVRAIDDERGSKVEIIVTEEGNDKEPAWEEFWTVLGGRGAIKSAEEGGADKGIQVTKRLFQLSDASGELKFTQVGEGAAVKRNLLNSNDVFILDDGGQIWAWVGKGSSAQERAKALAHADLYLHKFNRPPLTPISRVLEGGENEQFEASW
jgi:gelsolin